MLLGTRDEEVADFEELVVGRSLNHELVPEHELTQSGLEGTKVVLLMNLIF